MERATPLEAGACRAETLPTCSRRASGSRAGLLRLSVGHSPACGVRTRRDSESWAGLPRWRRPASSERSSRLALPTLTLSNARVGGFLRPVRGPEESRHRTVQDRSLHQPSARFQIGRFRGYKSGTPSAAQAPLAQLTSRYEMLGSQPERGVRTGVAPPGKRLGSERRHRSDRSILTCSSWIESTRFAKCWRPSPRITSSATDWPRNS